MKNAHLAHVRARMNRFLSNVVTDMWEDKVPYCKIRKRAKAADIEEYILQQTWKWTERIERMKDNKWTKLCAEWQPKRRGRGQEDDQAEGGGMTQLRRHVCLLIDWLLNVPATC